MEALPVLPSKRECHLPKAGNKHVLHSPPHNEPIGHLYMWQVSVCVHVQRTVQGLTLWAKAVKTLKQLAPIAILLRRWWLWHRVAHCYKEKPRRTGAQVRVYMHCAKNPKVSTWQTKQKKGQLKINEEMCLQVMSQEGRTCMCYACHKSMLFGGRINAQQCLPWCMACPKYVANMTSDTSGVCKCASLCYCYYFSTSA